MGLGLTGKHRWLQSFNASKSVPPFRLNGTTDSGQPQLAAEMGNAIFAVGAGKMHLAHVQHGECMAIKQPRKKGTTKNGVV